MEQKPNNKKPPMLPKMKKSQTITFWIVIILLIAVFYQYSKLGQDKLTTITFTDFLKLTENPGEIKRIDFNDKDIVITTEAGEKFTTYLTFRDPDLVKDLASKGINVNSQKPSRFLSIFLSWFPFLIFIGLWFFVMRGMRGGAGQAFSFGKSKAKLSSGDKTKITFKDVAGVDEAKEELEEIIEFLKAPKKFQRLGGKIPRGVLLLGRPGTGKTLLAKAVAGEAKVPFYSISGSDFVEMFVGVGASRVRDMFAQAKGNSPCIVFIDEIDAVGRHRGTGLGGGHDEREQTLNQLLVEMDGFDPSESVIIIAATNRPDVLDPALLRPGRFDRQVVVDLPDIKGRAEILQVHTRKLPISKDVSFSVIARATSGFSGADLANLVNEAALLAARKGKKKIEPDDFEEAKDKVTMGKARKSRIITDDDKKITSYHEIGHVLCAIFLEKSRPVHKVSIIPRGFAAGATHYLEEDNTHITKSFLEHTMIFALGGRAAEKIAFDEISAGAASDIQRVSDIAKKMVCAWGMSDEIGPMVVGGDDQMSFLGKQLTKTEMHSEETARIVDSEVRKLIKTAYDKALKILSEHRELLDILSEELIKEETLLADQLYEIILANIKDEEKEMVSRKLKKVQELKIDTVSDEEKESHEEIKDTEEEKPAEDSNESKTAESKQQPEEVKQMSNEQHKPDEQSNESSESSNNTTKKETTESEPQKK